MCSRSIKTYAGRVFFRKMKVGRKETDSGKGIKRASGISVTFLFLKRSSEENMAES